MTAKRLAEFALENGQTMSLCGNDLGASVVMIAALGLIAKANNHISDADADRFDELTLRCAKWRAKR